MKHSLTTGPVPPPPPPTIRLAPSQRRVGSGSSIAQKQRGRAKEESPPSLRALPAPRVSKATSLPAWGRGARPPGREAEPRLTFHHAAQEPAGSSGRPGPGRRPGSRRAVFSGDWSCGRLQRSPRGGGRIGVALALPLLQCRLALLLHHPPAAGRRSPSASVRWATGPEPCKGPRLRTRASRAPSPPPLGGGPECPDAKGGGTGSSPLSAAASADRRWKPGA